MMLISKTASEDPWDWNGKIFPLYVLKKEVIHHKHTLSTAQWKVQQTKDIGMKGNFSCRGGELVVDNGLTTEHLL